MKVSKRILAGIVAGVTTAGLGVSLAMAAPPVVPALPAEQQALVDAGFVKKATWARFDKQDGQCHLRVERSGANYYVYTSGKVNGIAYPIRPAHVVATVSLLNTNCQG